ncbi:unnamed protein product [Pseudo-nitzschia multistriata]|uniref:DNA 3'-5' helicase n=1 Tax=Pseudo-nitzschia multistriata TaxID=183589 RepID=A0A448ZEN4_9STRA|nr:unnamed protein product [Pseudo-nitzschia multistriata]
MTTNDLHRPSKRPLLSTGTSNKFSSRFSGADKKRAINARRPQPASVARLESLINGAIKKKRRQGNNRERMTTGAVNKGMQTSKPIRRCSNDGRDRGSMECSKTKPNSSHGSCSIGSQRQFKENTRNVSSGNDGARWSHVGSNNINTLGASKRRMVKNPFIEAKKRKQTAANAIDKNAAPDQSSNTVLSEARGSRKKAKRIRKETNTVHTEKNYNRGSALSKVISSEPTNPLYTSSWQSSRDKVPQRWIGNATHSTTIDVLAQGRNQRGQTSQPPPTTKDEMNRMPPEALSSPSSKSQEVSASLAHTVAADRETRRAIGSEAASTSAISSDASSRPKLGLSLSKKITKGKRSSISSSTPTSFRTTTAEISLAVCATANGHSLLSRTQGENEKADVSQGEDQRVLPSPEKVHRTNLLSADTTENNATRLGNISSDAGRNPKKKASFRKNINDNFVRLNMKNNAGACRGARKKSTKFSKERRTWCFQPPSGGRQDPYDSNTVANDGVTAPILAFDSTLPPLSLSPKKIDEETKDSKEEKNVGTRVNPSSKSNATSYVSRMSGLDPLDEFVDGTFHASKRKTLKDKSNTTLGPATGSTVNGTTCVVAGIVEPAVAPKCARHQRPCKLIKVRKNTSGNKGREFYACSMPRGEQCDHFQWADDTVEAARATLAKNSSYSSFVTRQVVAHVDRFRTLTVPELKRETSRRGLNKNGKKQQLLTRLAIWTRDEIVKCSPEFEEEEEIEAAKRDVEASDGSVKSIFDSSPSEELDNGEFSDDDDSSADELELFDGKNKLKESNYTDDDSEEDLSVESNDESPNTTLAAAKDIQGDDEGFLSASLREIFGHDSFRTGQEWAIQRCLEEKRSLLVAPTGFGKSLCYALPAALLDGVCIVVSPLISLIQDQLRSLPPRIPAATLSGSVSAAKTAAILDDIVRKRLKVLFVSPERLISPAFRRLFNFRWNPDTKTKERKFPEISLLCIDEAHCVSQWAHNFRPCFLRFKGFLKVMKPKSVLAITATAGPRVIKDIGETLGVDISETLTEDSSESPPDSECESIKIVRKGRDNIDVMTKFMSNEEERLAAVAGILTPSAGKYESQKESYAGKLATGSVIVYVWRQRDTEVVAESLVAAGVSGGVVMYHGGMDANARAKSQSKFMRGKARVCVATVAFGLGIDKADIVGIVHLYVSNSPEHYLQEIGRAGRDGRSAIAIALPLLEEVPIRHALVFSNLVAKSQIRSLLRIIKRMLESVVIVTGIENPTLARTFHIALPVQSTVRACDCKPETIETFLSLIERIGGDNPLLQIEGYNYDNATIALKKRTLKKLAEKEPVADSIQAVSQCIDAPLLEAGVEGDKDGNPAIPKSFQRQFLAYSKGSYSFSISHCANRLGPTAEPRHVFAALRRLQAFNELEFVLDTSEMGRVFHLKISEEGFKMFNRDDYGNMEEDLVETIYESFSCSANSSASKVLDMHYILDQVALSSASCIDENEDWSARNKSPSLVRFQEMTKTYFGEGLEAERTAVKDLLPASFSKIREKELEIDALSLLRNLPQLFQQQQSNIMPEYLELGQPSVTDYTALAITKFLYGMDTPRTPIFTFRQYPLFGKWKGANFGLVHPRGFVSPLPSSSSSLSLSTTKLFVLWNNRARTTFRLFRATPFEEVVERASASLEDVADRAGAILFSATLRSKLLASEASMKAALRI